MTKQAFNIGMIGAGGIAESRHLPNLLKIEGVKLVAVANRSLESGKRAADKYGFQKVYGTWQELVNDPAVDVVFVCTPPYMHREMTCYALSRGKHVFCQARMAMNLADAKVMLEADRNTSLTTMLCPPPHYIPVEPYVRKYLEAGKLGEIRHIALQHATSLVHDPSTPLHWRQRRDLQGINLLDVGIMGEVLNKWFGPMDKLSALSKTWIPERPADRDGKTTVELPDSVSVIGEFRNGAMLTALFTAAAEGGECAMTIYGSKGTLRLNDQLPHFWLRDREGERLIEIPAEQQGEWTVERDFLQAIVEGRKGSPSFEDGARYMAFTQAVTDSLQNGMSPATVQYP